MNPSSAPMCPFGYIMIPLFAVWLWYLMFQIFNLDRPMAVAGEEKNNDPDRRYKHKRARGESPYRKTIQTTELQKQDDNFESFEEDSEELQDDEDEQSLDEDEQSSDEDEQSSDEENSEEDSAKVQERLDEKDKYKQLSESFDRFLETGLDFPLSPRQHRRILRTYEQMLPFVPKNQHPPIKTIVKVLLEELNVCPVPNFVVPVRKATSTSPYQAPLYDNDEKLIRRILQNHVKLIE